MPDSSKDKTKELLKQARDLIAEARRVQNKIYDIARQLGELGGPNNGTKRFKFGTSLYVVEHKPGSRPDRQWRISEETVEMVE